MTDIAFVRPTRKMNMNWVLDVFFHPRKAFQEISTQVNGIWLTPLLILSIVVLINVIVGGSIKHQASLAGEITYPPDFQYWTPDQQAQYTQASQSTQSPVFLYVLPGISSLIGVWFGWLILGGALHLVATLFGGRGNTSNSINIVAWASLPLALKKVVQIVSMLITHKLISNPGLSGFGFTSDNGWLLFINQLLRLIDIYLVWQILLIILGIRIATKLKISKAALSTVITFIFILLLQSGLAYLVSRLGELQITRPFFF